MPREVTMNPNRRPAGRAALLAAGLAGPPPAAGGGGPQPAAASAAAASPTPAAAVAASAVDIANFAFSPAAITVKAGTTVTWTNRDEDAHTVAISGSPVSRPLQTGETYTHTFAQPGTYSYLCTIHPTMRGTVVVTAG